MPKYRKKSVVIDAVQWDGENWNEICEFLSIPENGNGAYKDGCRSPENMQVVIRALEEDMAASIGDYIVKDANGKFYPCNPGIFDKAYELVAP